MTKMPRVYVALTLILALRGFAQTGPAQPQSIRPGEPVALGTEYMSWSTGVSYTYDGSGNIRSIGSDTYVYDAVGRLVQSDLIGTRSNFGYDAFGNRVSCTQGAGDCQYSAVDADTNHLSSATYDPAGSGNVVGFWGHTYTYDAANMAKSDATTASTREYVYTADDERIAVYTVGSSWNWTVRDVSGKVLREFTSQNPASGLIGSASWAWSKDYVWREGSLLASRQTDPISGAITTSHYHVDHLGTPRRITDEQNRIVGIHDYYAFGGENALGTNESPVTRLKFTAHERDGAGPSAGPGMLDYMHARYYDAALGRFLSVDPGPSDLRRPQSWNRYVYAENNPIKNVDRDGRLSNPVTGEQGKGRPILHRGGGFGQIRKEQKNVKGSAGGEFGADRAGGRTHKGVDIIAPGGTPLVAAFSGKAYEIRENDKKLGLSVFVQGKDGVIAIYSHLSSTNLKEGDTVKEGQQVGEAGRSGNVMKEQPASEDHVHFQLYGENGKVTDPEAFLNDPKKQEKFRDPKDKEEKQQ